MDKHQEGKIKMFFCLGSYCTKNDDDPNTHSFTECNANTWNFLKALQKSHDTKGVYEYLRPETTMPYIKPYFDVDMLIDKKCESSEIEIKVQNIKNNLSPFFPDRTIEMCGNMRYNKEKKKWKLSFHIVILNCFIRRQSLRSLVKQLPEYFDKQPYSISTQKFRLVGMFKDNGGSKSGLKIYDDGKFRQAKLIDFQKHCIQNFDIHNDDEIMFNEKIESEQKDLEMFQSAINQRYVFTSKLTDREMETVLLKLNIRFVEMEENWFDVACALKNEGYSYELFDSFSKRSNGGNYNPSNNKTRWDSLTQNSNKAKKLSTILNFLRLSDVDHHNHVCKMLKKREADNQSGISGYTGLTSASTRPDHFRNVINILAEKCNEGGFAFDDDHIYKKVEPMFYKKIDFNDGKYGNVHAFITKYIFREITNDSVDWVLTRPHKVADLVKNTRIVAFKFKQFQYDRNVVSFNNGWLDIINWKFTNYSDNIPDNVYAKAHFDIEFETKWIEMEWTDIATPHYDSIWKSQKIEPDVLHVAYGLLGQLHFPADDNNFQVALYIKGTPDSGKSTLLEPIKNMFPVEKIGSFDHKQKTFGMTNLVHKFVCIDSDTPKDMVESIGKTEFQKLISAEEVILPVKNVQESIQLKLDLNTIIVSNYMQECQEAGEISRRLACIFFNPISGKDATLGKRIIKETPLILVKTILAYRSMKSKYEHHPFSEWGIEYFIQQKEEALYNNNHIYKFIEESDTYFIENNAETLWTQFENEFKIKNRGVKIKTTDQIFARMGLNVSINMICKFCRNNHTRGCCSKYTRTARTTRRVIKNLRHDSVGDMIMQ